MKTRLHLGLGIDDTDDRGHPITEIQKYIAVPSHGELTPIIQRMRAETLSLFDKLCFQTLQDVQLAWVLVVTISRELKTRQLPKGKLDHFIDIIFELTKWKNRLETWMQSSTWVSGEGPIHILRMSERVISDFYHYIDSLVSSGYITTEVLDQSTDRFSRLLQAYDGFQIFTRIEALKKIPYLKILVGTTLANIQRYLSEPDAISQSELVECGIQDLEAVSVHEWLLKLERDLIFS